MVNSRANSVIYGSKAQVYHGTADITRGGLKKKDIRRKKDKWGNYRYHAKKQLEKGKQTSAKSQKARSKWTKAMKKARKELLKEGKIKEGEFVPVGGKTRAGKALLKRTREIYQ